MINQISPTASMMTKYGNMSVISFSENSLVTHIAMFNKLGEEGKPLLLRIQSSCMTSTALGSVCCDCADQMHNALLKIQQEGCGLFIYLFEEGRGLGLHEKICGLHEMNQGASTVTAYTKRGLRADTRTYENAVEILKNITNINEIRLMTNNPSKIEAMQSNGFRIVERIPLEVESNNWTKKYMSSKKNELGHLITSAS